jgi:hypothetical protein
MTPEMSPAMTPEEVLVREAIRHTLSSYHLAGDRGRVADLVAQFTEDGVLELAGGSFAGRDAIAARLAEVGGDRPALPPGTRAFLHHHLTTSHLEILGPDEATGSHYFLVMSPVGIDHSGRYADRYRRVGDRWLIAHRTAVVTWAAPDSIVGAVVR